MASYEDDHNLPSTRHQTQAARHTVARQEGLSDFFANDGTQSGPQQQDIESLARVLQGLNNDSPLVHSLVSQLMSESENFGNLDGLMEEKPSGVPQQFLDSLDRVPKSQIKAQDSCAICATQYLSDPYPLVVRLTCNRLHHFDLECIGPWLKLHATCPLCRKNLLDKKEQIVADDSEEEWDDTFS